MRVAFAVGGSEEPDGGDAREIIARDIGDWVFQDRSELGIGEPVSSSVGRGAAGWVPAIEWVAAAAGAGLIGNAAWDAVKALFARLREEQPERRFLVSRGTAAHLAAAVVAEELGADEPLEIEAVEEPSSIAGAEVSELSYIGLEPWVVLLRDRWHNVRYLVVVAADGEIMGFIRAPMDQWENMYLPEPKTRANLPWTSDDDPE